MYHSSLYLQSLGRRRRWWSATLWRTRAHTARSTPPGTLSCSQPEGRSWARLTGLWFKRPLLIWALRPPEWFLIKVPGRCVTVHWERSAIETLGDRKCQNVIKAWKLQGLSSVSCISSTPDIPHKATSESKLGNQNYRPLFLNYTQYLAQSLSPTRLLINFVK